MRKPSLEPRDVAVLGALLRTLGALAGEDEGEEQALADAALRGKVMHGRPPGSEEEWTRAAELFDDAALAEFRRWAASGEGDGGDVRQPFRVGDGGADHADAPRRIEDEDGR